MADPDAALDPIARVLSLVGRWRGVSRVWFEPGKLAGEDPVEGDLSLLHGGRFAELSYRTSLKDKSIEGRITMGYYGDRRRWEVLMIDSFHMGRGQLFSVGDSTDHGFDVLGHYPDGQGGPDWGWRTELVVAGPDAFALTAFNVMPTGDEALATQLKLERQR